MNLEKIVMCWSTGKDSAFALFKLINSKKYNIVSLLTTVTQGYQRISMHGVRRELLQQQTHLLGFELSEVMIPNKASNGIYEAKMEEILLQYRDKGITLVAFGDIFLEDLKKYRENNLAKVNLKAIFPLWKKNTANLANQFIDLGFKAIVTCVNSKVLSKEFVGREFNKDFLAKLPLGVDLCGENGEFHSFVYDGPMFKERLNFKKGQIVLRNQRFYFCDLIPT